MRPGDSKQVRRTDAERIVAAARRPGAYMSEIARHVGRSQKFTSKALEQAGIRLESARGRSNPRGVRVDALHAANSARTAGAASRDVRIAQAILGDPRRYQALPRLQQDAVRVRAENPDASFAQLASMLEMTKDQYIGYWRRAQERR